MIPHDGMGYGRSLYWEMKAKQIAKKNHEFCPCWDITNPVIRPANDHSYKLTARCSEPSGDCMTDFHKTDKALTNKFKQFYKG